MSGEIADGAERLFARHVTKQVLRDAEAGVFPRASWDAVIAAGYAAALLPEAAGGFGATMAEAMLVLRSSARHAAPVPLAETMLGSMFLARAGLAVSDAMLAGVLTVAPIRSSERLTLRREGGDWRLTGTASRVPWAREAGAIVAVAEGSDGSVVACVPRGGFKVLHDVNLAGEPRDTVTFDAVLDEGSTAASEFSAAGLRAAGAAVRTVQIAGALSRALEISVAYAGTRVQFGRPIGKFQAIQQNLAVMAGQVAAGSAAAEMAAEALAGDLPPLLVGAAKARAGEAASIACGIAHQVHGAIGFTQEYELHPFTRRLWAWRDEFGHEAEWNGVVGRAALGAGAERLWPLLVGA